MNNINNLISCFHPSIFFSRISLVGLKGKEASDSIWLPLVYIRKATVVVFETSDNYTDTGSEVENNFFLKLFIEVKVTCRVTELNQIAKKTTANPTACLIIVNSPPNEGTVPPVP